MMQPLVCNRGLSRVWKLPWAPSRSKFIVAMALALIISTQLVLFALLYRPGHIHCPIPNLRSYWPDCKHDNYEQLPTIYVITPTYARHVQIADLTSMSHTLMLVPKIHWLIIEDSEFQTSRLTRFIERLKTEFDFHPVTHLNERTRGLRTSRYQPKGVWQRNKALHWIRENSNSLDKKGVLYFADDDNTYDVELFHEMRHTKRVSVWPVAFAGGLLVERPIAAENRVVGFNAVYFKSRLFPLDMAGFAVSLDLLISKSNATFDDHKAGQIESEFLKHLVHSWDDLEPKADNCRKILVWHTKTKVPSLSLEAKVTTPSTIGTDF